MNSQDATGATGSRSAAAAPVPASPRAGDLGDVRLPSGPEMPHAARAAVHDWLDGRAPASVIQDAQLLVSELVTNSCLHAGGANGAPVRIRAGRSNGSLWCEVGDAGRDGVVSRRVPSPVGDGGFGLHIVNLVAAQWGVTHGEGTEVWFTLALPTADAA